jgi:hypothetical protein
MDDIIFKTKGKETFRIPFPNFGTKCPETKLEVKEMTKYQPNPQTLEQKFEEIPELLDQVDALMEFYPLPTQVWRDIKKLMILSYDKGYSRGGYDTHMKYAGTD